MSGRDTWECDGRVMYLPRAGRGALHQLKKGEWEHHWGPHGAVHGLALYLDFMKLF